jgi:hypothetical protein
LTTYAFKNICCDELNDANYVWYYEILGDGA